jgi:uncharacterized protein (DUF58 family)
MKQPPVARLKLTNRLVPLVVALLLGLELTFPHKAWLILLLGLGGLWGLCFWWARTLAHGLHLTRQMRFGWAQVGDRLEEHFILTNYTWVPGLWVELEDHSTLPDYRASQVTGIGSHAENSWTTASTCTRRGIFSLGPTTIHSSDPFNLYSITIDYPDSATLTVTPPIVPLPAIEVAPGGRTGEGRPHVRALERTVSVATVRDYIPGDSLRAIHWPTSARHNDLFVRLFENTPAGDWLIVLDLDERFQVGQGQTSTEEHGVILAASLADRGLHRGRAVGLLAHSDTLTWLPPRSGDGQRLQILQALATARPGPQPLASLLAQPSFGRLASLIVITPTIDRGWVEALSPILRYSAVATVLVLDPPAFGGSQSAQPLVTLLANLNIVHHLITPALLQGAGLIPGQQGQWDWRISPLGRAVAGRPQQDMSWRGLG